MSPKILAFSIENWIVKVKDFHSVHLRVTNSYYKNSLKSLIGESCHGDQKKSSFLFMSNCKGGIGLIKAVSALFIHKYLYKKILPQVKSISQKHTGFLMHSREVFCSFPRQ